MCTARLQIVRHSALMATLVWLCLPGGVVRAADWTSPDGLVVVTVPDPERFLPIEPAPEPFLVLWMSEDESLRLGVTRMANPNRIPLEREGVEEGFAAILNGTITASSSSMVNGHEVLFMTATGSLRGVPAILTQAVVVHEDQSYKLMATKVGQSTPEPALDAFVKSIRLTKAGAGERIRDGNGSEDANEVKEFFRSSGSAAGMLLILVVIILLLSRRGKKIAPSDPT